MSCFIMSPESIRTLGNTLDSVFNAAKYSNVHSITTAAVCNTSAVYAPYNIICTYRTGKGLAPCAIVATACNYRLTLFDDLILLLDSNCC